VGCLLSPGPAYVQALRWSDTAWGALRAGHVTAAPAPVFGRLMLPEEVEAAVAAAAAKGASAAKTAGKNQPKQPKKSKAAAETAAQQVTA
jgi:hypothetical protein